MGCAVPAGQRLLSQASLQFVTDFADQAIILPVAVLVGLAFAWRAWWRGVRAWSAVVAGVLALMLGLKIAGEVWANIRGVPPISPSGHVASASTIYGGLAMMLRPRTWSRRVAVAVPLLIACVIGYTRIGLQAHDLSEVIIGGVIGVTGAVLLAVLAGPAPRSLALPVIVAIAATSLALHGTRLPIEQQIHAAFTGP